ncbi:MAG: AAA family ATPase [Candidatus Hydrogenedentes bacterium CG07_land_8_20_14_0_80_42_17]|nr:MAG: AAA family ATPase [Candidatus Hydrogenedentes bacterium CG07_land_8_20_14_0_80_42_17]
MLRKIRVNNFKKLNATLDLSQTVVFVGPNNSGKSSILQAITLWSLGLAKWAEAKKESKAKKRVGVAINRKDLINIPVPSAKQLWKDLVVRGSGKSKGKQTINIKIEIEVEGFTDGENWKLGFEFDYANSESFYCRIINHNHHEDNIKFALREKIGLLPPMSGLAGEEDKLELGSISSRIGEGKTADVLRNLCWYVLNSKPEKWNELTNIIATLFGITINEPQYDIFTGKITMTYEENRKKFDLSNGGRGFHQILLIFSYIYANNNSIILLDEPDAHLEILRQKQVFNILSEKLKRENAQLMIATHSISVLDEATEKSSIIAFIGKPHIVNNKSQLVKSLTSIGFEQYLLAEQKGWILYLEGSTDLSILKEYAKILNHPVLPYLESPFVKYVTNLPSVAREHFYGLQEGVSKLKGVALFDKINAKLQQNDLVEMMWKRREIENYLPIPEVIERYVSEPSKDLFSLHDTELMADIIKDEIPPAALKDKNHSWWINSKISDDFLDKVFSKYFQTRKMPILFNKSDYYILASFSKADELEPEITEKLDLIYETASQKEKL